MRQTTSSVFRLAAVAGSLAIASTCFAQATTNPDAAATKRDLDLNQVRQGPERAGWWNDAVFYHMFVRSFKDSDVGPLAGDGVGDIRGIIDQLDYLNDGDPTTDTDLGITGLWLLPIHPSPGYHGYEVADFYAVNPQYGTIEDFRELIRECDKRGIKVILDLVLNHISYTHPWFVEASRDPNSPKRDWFIWSDTVPTWKGPWNQSVWWPAGARPGDKPPEPGTGPDNDPATEDPSYYYSIFYLTMPDVNYRSKGASDAMLDVVKHWIEKEGVAGYRLDAIRHLVEDGPIQENTPETHEWLRLFHKTYKASNPEAFTIGEVWTDSATAATYVGDQLDTCFEFDLSYAMMDAARDQNPARVRDAQRKVLAVYPPGQYGRFLTNHDQNRVMSTLGGNVGAARSAACMLLLGPGVPFIYYGEELGLEGEKPDPNLRTPMRWNTQSNAGFTQGSPWIAVGDDAKTRNVQIMRSDESSLFNLYRRLIHVRNAHPSLKHGVYQPLLASDAKTYAYLRVTNDDAGSVREVAIVAINLGDQDAENVRVSALAQAPEIALNNASWSGELVWAGQRNTPDAMASFDVGNVATGLEVGNVPAHDAVIWILKKK
jgi:glycosidase